MMILNKIVLIFLSDTQVESRRGCMEKFPLRHSGSPEGKFSVNPNTFQHFVGLVTGSDWCMG